jgi:hypothetical protein
MLRKSLFTAIPVVLIAMLVLTTVVSGLAGGTWQSGIKIQNLDPSNPANLSVSLYGSGGGSPIHVITQTSGGSPLTAQPNKSVEVYLPAFSSVTAGQYSAVVSSDRNVGAVVTTTNYPYGMADSYNSMVPSTSVFVPYVYRNHNNWSTEIFVQNTTGTNITGSIVFTEPSTSVSYSDSGVHTKTVNFNIPAYGTQSFDTLTSTYNDMGWFIGSATIQSSAPIAVMANQTRLVGNGDIQGNVLISARGLSSNDAGTKILLPSLYNNFSGASGTWRSGIKIVNSSSSTANITVEFKSDPGMPSFSGTKTLSISAGGNTELYLPSTTLNTPAGPMPNQFKGYAIINSNVPVVATVQHTNYEGASGYGVAVGYAGFSSGSRNISLPSLYHWPSGSGVWISGIKVQNYGTTNATFTITYSADPDSISSLNGTKSNVTLTPGQAIEFYFGNPILDGNGSIPSGWKGSAFIQGSAGAQLVATVIHTNYGRHVATMYTGVPIP